MSDTAPDIRDKLLQAILAHVPFEGWTPAAFEAAVAEAGVEMADARVACARGATDLAVRAHKGADAALGAAFAAAEKTDLRYSQKVALAVRLRLDLAGDKEVVRKATAHFALPYLAIEGAGLIWGTADAIWTVLGDTSLDFNWYSKRATLAGVYGSSVLYWLGDQGDGTETTAFIDRRIADVMRFEKFKSDAKASKVLGPLAKGFEDMTSNVRAPSYARGPDFSDGTKGQGT